MFKLLKLAIVALAGYALYELLLDRDDLIEDGGRRLAEAANRPDSGRLGTLTGPGRGARATTEELSGMSTPHIVGRGVRR